MGYVQASEASAHQAFLETRFYIDEETNALLEEEKLLFNRKLLRLGPVIRQGHFGCVYRGTLKMECEVESQDVAVKTLRNNSRGGQDNSQSFLQEVLIMKDFGSVNVLPPIGLTIDDREGLMVITPHMKYGDLLSYIRIEENLPPVKQLITFGIHVAEGMRYLADMKFVHTVLAVRKCMVNQDLVIRVADFGLSRDIYQNDYYRGDNNAKLPVRWMAPESLEKGIYNYKPDVWSYDVVLWEILTGGVMPYPDVQNWEVEKFLKQGRRMERPAFCPKELYNIMLQCWNREPKMLPPFKKLVTDVVNVISKLENSISGQRESLHMNRSTSHLAWETVTALNHSKVECERAERVFLVDLRTVRACLALGIKFPNHRRASVE